MFPLRETRSIQLLGNHSPVVLRCPCSRLVFPQSHITSHPREGDQYLPPPVPDDILVCMRVLTRARAILDMRIELEAGICTDEDMTLLLMSTPGMCSDASTLGV